MPPDNPEHSPRPPTPQELQFGNDVLRSFQAMLVSLGQNQRRHAPEFQQVMALYKELGAQLHESRKQAAQARPQAPRPTAAGSPPRQVSALERARAAGGPTALGRPGLSNRPGAALARPAAQPPLVNAAPEQPAPPLDTRAEVLPLPREERVLPAVSEVREAAPPQPLALPKFKSALGPKGSPSVSQGPEVENLQQLLAHLGYEVTPTGSFDLATVKAVNFFQKHHRLPLNQVVGLEMRRMLNELVTG